MRDGFLKVAAATPALQVADCTYNTEKILEQIDYAYAHGVKVLVFPELCITGYTCQDLFFQHTLQQGALQSLNVIAKHTAGKEIVCIVGLPYMHNNKLYNCAAVLLQGTVLGFVPKTNLPNYNEFYEKRHFATPLPYNETTIYNGCPIPFGTKLLFQCMEMPELSLAVEICEDLWVTQPVSINHALAGATLIANLSASDETIGKDAYRRSLVTGQSAQLICGYIYCDAGQGESTTDMVFAGHNLIAENGTLLAESALFTQSTIITEIDLQRLNAERAKLTSFSAAQTQNYHIISFHLQIQPTSLSRTISAAPFIPQNMLERNTRCENILQIQAHGLAKRLQHSRCNTLVVGISGGLDSCLALLVAAKAIDLLGRDRKDIIAITMPCFGTTQRTKGNAEAMVEQLNATLKCIEITEAVRLHFRDIAHEESVQDVTYENAQARERTQVLMDVANQTNGLVVGTGDLSELALGWATYNGDHMSMYGVNASIPKTLIRHIVKYVADTADNKALQKTLLDILDTPVSPELLPAKNGEISQCTEDLVGPYELHDFFLYYLVRWGFGPAKIYRLAIYAFNGAYPPVTILKWLRIFCKRFFQQQFKRSCLPDSPKVGSVTLSPRGDWRMPSDACCTLWLAELEDL
ncbi:MAG: NAD(+) synthase [Oscillospiraceae bacterium]|nr:NAD(+) synthase [Oscillospiraceae bacterium]